MRIEWTLQPTTSRARASHSYHQLDPQISITETAKLSTHQKLEHYHKMASRNQNPDQEKSKCQKQNHSRTRNISPDASPPRRRKQEKGKRERKKERKKEKSKLGALWVVSESESGWLAAKWVLELVYRSWLAGVVLHVLSVFRINVLVCCILLLSSIGWHWGVNLYLLESERLSLCPFVYHFWVPFPLNYPYCLLLL